MKTILCFGDSNTYGSNPAGTPCRHPYAVRWTGRLQRLLGEKFRVVEEGLGGRTTVWDDPMEPNRRGIDFLPVALQSHMPVDLVILSLGTNDCKNIFPASARAITRGMRRLVETVRHFDFGAGEPGPEILLVAPIRLGENAAQSVFDTFDEALIEKTEQLAVLYRELAEETGCMFLDAGTMAGPGADQVHMDAAGHAALAGALAALIRERFAE